MMMDDNIHIFALIFVAAVLYPSATLAQQGVGHWPSPSFGIDSMYDEGDVRLAGGSSSSEGRVEIYHNNQWGTVCDDYWDDVDADVVCRQLGYNRAIMATDRAYYGQGVGPVWLDNVDCTGYESELTDCYDRGWGVADCSHAEDAGAVCSNSLATNGDLRLSDGLLLEEGRVEIYYNGVWGTICDDGWNYDEARVACYQLGYGGVTYSDTYYGSGEGPILLDDVFCYGWESKLTYCYHDPWYSNNCGHQEDVGIRCYRSGSGMSGWLISIIVISSLFVCGALVAVLARMCSKNKSKRNRNMQHQNVVYQNDTGNTTITTTGTAQPYPTDGNAYGQPYYMQPYAQPPMSYGAPPPTYTATIDGTYPAPTSQPGTVNLDPAYPPQPSTAPPAAPGSVNPAGAYPPPPASTTAPGTMNAAGAYPPPSPSAYPPQPATAPPTIPLPPTPTAAPSMPTPGAMEGASTLPPTGENSGNVNPGFQA